VVASGLPICGSVVQYLRKRIYTQVLEITRGGKNEHSNNSSKQ